MLKDEGVEKLNDKLFMYLFTNCNWAYTRWQCLHKMNEHR
jgi:hypothetical protein